MTTTACEIPTRETIAEPAPNEQHLWERYQQDGTGENALIEHYLPLVRTVLGRLAMTLPEHVDEDDLNSAGLIGLLQALRNYDAGCGTSFAGYARLRIRGAMLDELRRMDWVPRSVHEKARQVEKTIARLEQALGCPPSEARVAHALKLTLTAYRRLLNEIRPATFVCLDAVSHSESGEAGSLADVVADPSQVGPVEEVSHRELKQIILARLRGLSANQRKVMALFYGKGLRLREIAHVMGLTESRICQIHSQAVLSIRAYLQRFEAGMET